MFRRATWSALAGWLVIALLVSVPPAGADEDFVLDPGYIVGTFSTPGFTQTSGSVGASATAPDGTSYSGSAAVVDGEYEVVVEAGPWEYEIQMVGGLEYLGLRGSFQLNRFATVASGQTVHEDVVFDAKVRGDITLQGAVPDQYTLEIEAIDTPRTNDAYHYRCSMKYGGTGHYEIPVVGGATRYRLTLVSTSFSQYHVAMVGLAEFELEVDPGEIVEQDIDLSMGFVSGLVTLDGGTITQSGVTCFCPSSAGTAHGSVQLQPDGTFMVPLLPGTCVAQGYILSDVGRFDFDVKTFEVVAGETTEIGWAFEAPPVGTVSGRLQSESVELTKARVSVGDRTCDMTGEGMYLVENCEVGIQPFRAMMQRELVTSEWYSFTRYYPPREWIDVVGGETLEKDVLLDPGFIDVRIFDPETPGVAGIYSSGVEFQGGQFSSAERLTGSGTDYIEDPVTGWGANEFSTFAPPGTWRPWKVSAEYLVDNPQGESRVRVTIEETLGNEDLPAVTVASGQTSSLALGYEVAKVIVHLRVVGGAPLSDPMASANYLANLDGVVDKQRVQVSGWTYTDDVAEGIVVLYLLPGTWEMGGQATVNGSRTTFGTMEITVGAGDIIDLDLTGPVITLFTPAPNEELHQSAVLVTGTVWDESGVSSLEIDGQEVAFDPDTGYFEHTVTGLSRGANDFTVTAVDFNDNESSVTRTVYVVNTGPVAVLSAPETVEATGPNGAAVALDGSDSWDPDGDALSFEWRVDGVPAGTGSSQMPLLSVGAHVVELKVYDPSGEFGTASATVTVVDTTPPAVTVSAVTPGSLWPPDHKMQLVELDLIIEDVVDQAVDCRVTSIESNEADDGEGDGDTEEDWSFTGALNDLDVQLRAERSGAGEGRVYTITVECRDDSGNVTEVKILVPVAHDAGENTVIITQSPVASAASTGETTGTTDLADTAPSVPTTASSIRGKDHMTVPGPPFPRGPGALRAMSTSWHVEGRKREGRRGWPSCPRVPGRVRPAPPGPGPAEPTHREPAPG